MPGGMQRFPGVARVVHARDTHAADKRVCALGALHLCLSSSIGEFEFGDGGVAAAKDEIQLAFMHRQEISGAI